MKAPSSFAPFLCFSFVSHLILFFLISLNLDLSSFRLTKKKTVKIRQAIRVDSIGLPELHAPRLSPSPSTSSQSKTPVLKKPGPPKKKPKPLKKKRKTAKKKPAKKVISKKKQQQNKKLQEDRKRQAMEKLRALRQIEKMRQAQQNPAYKGQQISRGDSSSGEVVKNFEMVQYFTSLKARIKMYWSLPQELADQSLRAKIFVRISDQGSVLHRYIMEASGNEEFDARVLESIDRAGPFSPPPASVKAYLAQGVVLSFPEQ